MLCDVRLEKEIHDIRCKKEEEEAERIERYSSVLVLCVNLDEAASIDPSTVLFRIKSCP